MFYKSMMDVLCEHCGKEIPGNSKFCRYCGQPVVPQPPIPSESEPSKLPLILVCKIIGGPGVELSRAGSGKNEIFSVTWSSPSVLGANIPVMFKGGKVESKVQLGLQ